MYPTALDLGVVTIHWYGVLFAFGFVAGLWTASRRGLRDGLASESVLDLGPWLIVGGVLGARTLFVISYWDEYFAADPFPEIFMIQNGGLVFYGGLIGATAAGVVYLLWKKLPLWKMADAFAPSIALGHVFGRFGCFLNGCCHGTPTSLPWGVRFPEGHETRPALVHPTQIYESALNLTLYAALAVLHKRKRFDGQIFAIYLMSYACLRFGVEFLRGDYGTADRWIGVLTPGQVTGVPLLVAGIVLYARKAKRP